MCVGKISTAVDLPLAPVFAASSPLDLQPLRRFSSLGTARRLPSTRLSVYLRMRKKTGGAHAKPRLHKERGKEVYTPHSLPPCMKETVFTDKPTFSGSAVAKETNYSSPLQRRASEYATYMVRQAVPGGGI